jgi:hypothetical protein
VGRKMVNGQAAPRHIGVFGAAQHRFDKIAVIEIDLERDVRKVNGGELEGGLREIDTVIVPDLRSVQRGLHHAGVAAGNVEKREGLGELLVEGGPQEGRQLAVRHAVAFDQLAVGFPLLLELCQRRGINDGTAGLELMNMDVDQGRRPHRSATLYQCPFTSFMSRCFELVSQSTQTRTSPNELISQTSRSSDLPLRSSA